MSTEPSGIELSAFKQFAWNKVDALLLIRNFQFWQINIYLMNFFKHVR